MKTKTYNIVDCQDILISGRTTITGNNVNLFWTASGIECNIAAAELWIQCNADYSSFEPWIEVSINGALTSRQMVPRGKTWICIFRSMSSDQIKHVCIRKATQAMNEDPVHRLAICKVKTDGTFRPLDKKSCRIEFVGDSITSGEGLVGARCETDWISMFMSTQNNYAVLTAEALNADFRLISQGGWGVVCGWNNNPNSNIPRHYRKICGGVTGVTNKKLGAYRDNDFSTWRPDVIVVNLGTNDTGSFDQPPFTNPVTGQTFKNRREPDGTLNKEDAKRYSDAVQHFLQDIRSANPTSHIVWTLGMFEGDLLSITRQAVEQFAADTADPAVQFLQLDPMTDETTGARGHPAPVVHQAAAEKISRMLRTLLDL